MGCLDEYGPISKDIPIETVTQCKQHQISESADNWNPTEIVDKMDSPTDKERAQTMLSKVPFYDKRMAYFSKKAKS